MESGKGESLEGPRLSERCGPLDKAKCTHLTSLDIGNHLSAMIPIELALEFDLLTSC